MNRLKIESREIAIDTLPFIIAEIGNNHDGNKKQALELIDAAAKAGADAVKFQTYDPDELVHPDHELYEFFSSYRLPHEWHEELKKRAESHGMVFLSTPFDRQSAVFLNSLGIAAFKISSSDLTNLSLIRKCAEFGKPLLISTGMGSLKEAGIAIEAAHMKDNYQLAVLHCVSVYPTPIGKCQLNSIVEFRRLFDIVTGFSDHSLSPTLPVAAVALGARIVEKHFTLSRKLKGPDHAVALEPGEFSLMAQGCREVCIALAKPGKIVTTELKKVRSASLRGIYARNDLHAGDTVTPDMLIFIRPAAVLTEADLPALLGKAIKHDITRLTAITLDDVE
jgi:sialic acid synthase SpsE